jgi:hypothetical protein
MKVFSGENKSEQKELKRALIADLIIQMGKM